MKFDHIVTVADFENLPDDQKRECFDQKWKAVKERHELEQALVPRLPFKPTPPPQPERKSVGPAISSDPDTAVKEFFTQHPNARQILIGDVLYERSRR